MLKENFEPAMNYNLKALPVHRKVWLPFNDFNWILGTQHEICFLFTSNFILLLFGRDLIMISKELKATEYRTRVAPG
ncbi:CLUMA_CG008797, isoform A [Clunio marinus]|uniref:CLUMA_CG008797, isoform A n=1 Tax=Clunio marinus TaxID=568069 RepID=A0A1J1I6A6_9DIPT|nr:CLUMA_CG008797, isoform A [Clunio marinus]